MEFRNCRNLLLGEMVYGRLQIKCTSTATCCVQDYLQNLTQQKDQCLVPSLMVMDGGTQVRTITNCEKNVFYSFSLLGFFLYYYYYYYSRLDYYLLSSVVRGALCVQYYIDHLQATAQILTKFQCCLFSGTNCSELSAACWLR